MPKNRTEQPPQAQQGAQNKHFWNFVPATESKPPELLLYGDISSGRSWWSDNITPAQFNQELAALGSVEELVVRINSGGGDVFAANAIYCRLRDLDAKVTVKIDGWAASAATIIAMAGDVIQIPRNGVFMVHDPAMTVWDTFRAEDFDKMAQELRVIKQSIVNAYTDRTHMKAEEINAIMAAETWWTGEEAVAKGFCDSLMFEADPQTVVENSQKVVVNHVSMDLSGYKTLPKVLLTGQDPGGLQNKNQVQKGDHKNMDPKNINNVSDLEAAYPELCQQIKDSATQQERGRIKDIMDNVPGGYEDIVHEAMFDKPVNAGQVALRIVAKQKAQGAAYQAGAQKDSQASHIDDVKPGGSETGGGDGKSVFDRAIDEVL